MRGPGRLILDHEDPLQGVQIALNGLRMQGARVPARISRDDGDRRLRGHVPAQRLQHPPNQHRVAADAIHTPDVGSTDLFQVIADEPSGIVGRGADRSRPAAPADELDEIRDRRPVALRRHPLGAQHRAQGHLPGRMSGLETCATSISRCIQSGSRNACDWIPDVHGRATALTHEEASRVEKTAPGGGACLMCLRGKHIRSGRGRPMVPPARRPSIHTSCRPRLSRSSRPPRSPGDALPSAIGREARAPAALLPHRLASGGEADPSNPFLCRSHDHPACLALN